jgi:hypothetical protein
METGKDLIGDGGVPVSALTTGAVPIHILQKLDSLPSKLGALLRGLLDARVWPTHSPWDGPIAYTRKLRARSLCG